MNDFYPDPVMLRRIQRQVKAEADADDDADEEDDEGEEDDNEDSSMRVTRERSVKSERGRDRGRELLEAIEDA